MFSSCAVIVGDTFEDEREWAWPCSSYAGCITPAPLSTSTFHGLIVYGTPTATVGTGCCTACVFVPFVFKRKDTWSRSLLNKSSSSFLLLVYGTLSPGTTFVFFFVVSFDRAPTFWMFSSCAVIVGDTFEDEREWAWPCSSYAGCITPAPLSTSTFHGLIVYGTPTATVGTGCCTACVFVPFVFKWKDTWSRSNKSSSSFLHLFYGTSWFPRSSVYYGFISSGSKYSGFSLHCIWKKIDINWTRIFSNNTIEFVTVLYRVGKIYHKITTMFILENVTVIFNLQSKPWSKIIVVDVDFSFHEFGFEQVWKRL